MEEELVQRVKEYANFNNIMYVKTSSKMKNK